MLGICGVVGAGKEEICSVLCGDEDYDSGQLFVKGVAQRLSSPAEALSAGIIMVPKERRGEGMMANSLIGGKGSRIRTILGVMLVIMK